MCVYNAAQHFDKRIEALEACLEVLTEGRQLAPFTRGVLASLPRRVDTKREQDAKDDERAFSSLDGPHPDCLELLPSFAAPIRWRSGPSGAQRQLPHREHYRPSSVRDTAPSNAPCAVRYSRACSTASCRIAVD